MSNISRYSMRFRCFFPSTLAWFLWLCSSLSNWLFSLWLSCLHNSLFRSLCIYFLFFFFLNWCLFCWLSILRYLNFLFFSWFSFLFFSWYLRFCLYLFRSLSSKKGFNCTGFSSCYFNSWCWWLNSVDFLFFFLWSFFTFSCLRSFLFLLITIKFFTYCILLFFFFDSRFSISFSSFIIFNFLLSNL